MVRRLASREVRIEKRGCGALVMGVDRSDSFPRPGSREADLNTLVFQTADAVEGMMAFLEKRKPKFRDE
jgi:enoyl-CoA hydratase/carnithine racemase